jgi:hypothetical protein
MAVRFRLSASVAERKKASHCEAFARREDDYFLRAAIDFSAVLTRSAPTVFFHLL